MYHIFLSHATHHTSARPNHIHSFVCYLIDPWMMTIFSFFGRIVFHFSTALLVTQYMYRMYERHEFCCFCQLFSHESLKNLHIGKRFHSDTRIRTHASLSRCLSYSRNDTGFLFSHYTLVWRLAVHYALTMNTMHPFVNYLSYAYEMHQCTF